MGYCHKCEMDTEYETPIYRREGEDTYDFSLCHECEKEMWGGFLTETANFNWEEDGED